MNRHKRKSLKNLRCSYAYVTAALASASASFATRTCLYLCFPISRYKFSKLIFRMSDSPQAPLLIWAGFICRMLAGMSSTKSFHLECLLHAEMACSHPPPLPTPRDNDCMYFLLLWLVLSAITIIIVMLRAQKSMNSVSLYAAVL